MADRDTQQPIQEEKPQRRVRDIPRWIKFFLLAFLIILLILELASGEFREMGWLAWLFVAIKLVLIIGLIILIWVQRRIIAELTGPTGCTEEEPDPIQGILFVRVTGTAAGVAAASYTLEVRKVGDLTPIPDIVSYPGGGTSGVPPVIGAELGRINTTGLADDAYQITLIVYPAGAGAPVTRTITFTLLKVIVYISRVGEIPVVSHAPIPDNLNPFDESAELHKEFAAAPPPHDYRLVSVGGRLTIHGAAYIYECPGRKIARYEIRYARVTAPGPEPAQPATDAPIPATWPGAQQIVELVYSTSDHYLLWTRVGPAPRELTNTFTTFTIGTSTYYKLRPFAWNSSSLNGRFSLLLIAEDTTAGPHRYYDIQHIWIDNKPIVGRITGVAGVAPCAVIRLKDFVSSSISIEGIAWDPLIDEAFNPNLVPNDNFGGYELRIYKQGVGTPYVITSSNTRVPSAKTGPPGFPTDADAGTLGTFDIAAALDAGNPTPPPGVPPAIKIPRGEGCAYYFWLHVWDKTRLNDDSDIHEVWNIWPICVHNNIGT
jgi:hypothetical protein